MNRPDEHELDHEQQGRPDAEVHGLAAAYALGALDDAERARFERALAGSPALQAEVDAFQETAANLGEATTAVEPPSRLKDRLFARLDDVPQERAPGAPQTWAPRVPQAPAPDAPLESVERETFDRDALAAGGPVDELAARRARRRLALALSSAAAVVLIAAGVVFGLSWPGPNGWGAQRELAQLSQAGDAQTQTIEVAGGGEVTLVWSAERGRSAVRTQDLPDVGDDRTYELWYIDESGATPAGTFDAPGDAGTWRILEGEFAPGVVVGLTVEPAGGSEQPTSEPIAAITT